MEKRSNPQPGRAPLARLETLETRVLFNAAPFAELDQYTTVQDGPAILLDVLLNDTDGDNDPLVLTGVTAPHFGTAVIVGNQVRFTPAPGFSGQDAFDYAMRDSGHGVDNEFDSATVIIQVQPGLNNAAPYAELDNLTITNNAGAAVDLDVLLNDNDPDGDPLTVSAITFAPTFGTATILANNKVRYTPDAGYAGQDYFAYEISDGRGGTDSATAILTVQPGAGANTAPYADLDNLTITNNAGAPVDLDVLLNDNDPDGDPLTVSAITFAPTFGTATVLANNKVRYTPNAGYTGQDYFAYEISDGRGGTDSATAILTVQPGVGVNTAPFADLDLFTFFNNGGPTDLNVLLNDSDPDNDPLTVSAITFAPTFGTATILANNKVRYTPNAGYTGQDNFAYEISDGRGGLDSATAILTIPNRSPVAANDTATLEQDSGSATINVLANDTDPDAHLLSIASVTQGTHGSVAIDAGVVLYTPSAGYSGPDSFTYTVDDGNGGTATASVAVTVTPVNRGTLGLGADTLFVNEDAGTLTFTVIRTGGSDGIVSATYVTVDGTATPGVDYTAVSGNAVFADGQTQVQVTIPILDDTNAEADETFTVSLNAVGGGAALGTPRTALATILDNDTVEIGDGLNAQYFNKLDLASLALTRIDPTINFNWNANTPDPLVDENTFSTRWTGTLEVPVTGTYTFRTHTDDGARLWVNRQLLVDDWTIHGPTSNTGTIDLIANTRVDLQMDYYQGHGGALAELHWTVPGQAETIIPTIAMFSDDITPINIAGLDELVGETVVTGLSLPTAMDFAPDGTMFIAQKNGVVRVAQNGTLLPTPFIDFSAATNNVRDRGMLGIAVHPDFTNNPYVYLLYTYDPPETVGQSGFAAPDQHGNRPARLSRFTADAATGFTTAIAGSEVVILGTNSTWANTVRPDLDSTADFTLPPSGFDAAGVPIRDYIATDSQSHTIGSLDFGADGSLYVSVGDGASYGNVDPRAIRVQNIDNLSGKILRIDPLTGAGLPDNPYFITGDAGANRSKVFARGLRNPFRIAVNPTTDDVYIGDVGWGSWEEVNIATGGENFGWPFYEGNDETGGYRDLPEADIFYNSGTVVTSPIFATNHVGGSSSIVLGDFYTGSLYTGYTGALFFTDFNRQTIRAMLFNPDGSVQQVVTAAQPIGALAEMTMGLDGYLYYVDLGAGKIGRFVEPSNASGPPAPQTQQRQRQAQPVIQTDTPLFRHDDPKAQTTERSARSAPDARQARTGRSRGAAPPSR